jgi:hypothetical protein
MEVTMQKIFLAIPLVALVVALTAQADAASQYQRTRTKDLGVMSEQLRNNDAYVAPDISVQSDSFAKDAMAPHYMQGSCWDLGTCD